MRRAALALAALAATACEGPHLGSPWDFERMLEQPRYDPYETSAFFEDGMAMRSPPAGTMPWRTPDAPAPIPETPSGDALPIPVDAALLARGRERFEIVCAPCHGLDGRAETPVAQSMALRPPPSLHEPRLRALDAATLERTVARGYGLMPSYAPLLDARDRWAVAAYVQALQLSQHAELAALPPDVRSEAEHALATGAGGSP